MWGFSQALLHGGGGTLGDEEKAGLWDWSGGTLLFQLRGKVVSGHDLKAGLRAGGLRGVLPRACCLLQQPCSAGHHAWLRSCGA